MQQELQQAQAVHESLKEQLASQAEAIEQQLQELEELKANVADLQSQLGEDILSTTSDVPLMPVNNMHTAIHLACTRTNCSHPAQA